MLQPGLQCQKAVLSAGVNADFLRQKTYFSDASVSACRSAGYYAVKNADVSAFGYAGVNNGSSAGRNTCVFAGQNNVCFSTFEAANSV